MHRVMIIGCSGAGKSTLALRLRKRTGLPVVHIDQLYWKEAWTRRPIEEVRAAVGRAAEQPQWIFEGNNASSFDLRIARADTLIFLDLPTWMCLYCVLRRLWIHHGKTRGDLAPGCPERFDWPFLKWIWNYRKHARPDALKLLQQAPASVTVHHFTTRKAVRDFVSRL